VGTTATIQKGHFDGNLEIAVPEDAPDGKNGIFFTVFFTPIGGTYETRLAEDRNYNTEFGRATTVGAVLGSKRNNVWSNIRGGNGGDDGGGLLGWLGGR